MFGLILKMFIELLTGLDNGFNRTKCRSLSNEKIMTQSALINHANVNVNWQMVENVIQIKIGIMMNVDASAKNVIYMKKFIFGILLHVVAKMVNIY